MNTDAHNKTTALYRHYDKAGRLLYVGISLNAINRLTQHRDCSPWYQDIEKVTIEHFETRKKATAAEKQAISQESPAHNVAHNRPPKPPPSKVRAEKEKARFLSRMVNYQLIYSRAEVATHLRIGELAVRKLMDDGKLGYFSRGQRRYSTGWQLIDYIESIGGFDSPRDDL